MWPCNRHWSYLRSWLNLSRSSTTRGPLAAKTRVQHAVVGQFRATFRVSTCLNRVRCKISVSQSVAGAHTDASGPQLALLRCGDGRAATNEAYSDERGMEKPSCSRSWWPPARSHPGFADGSARRTARGAKQWPSGPSIATFEWPTHGSSLERGQRFAPEARTSHRQAVVILLEWPCCGYIAHHDAQPVTEA